MICSEAPKAQAYADGEIGAIDAAAMERHLEGCGECRALVDDILDTRSMLRGQSAVRAPAALRARIMRSLDHEAPAAPNPRIWRTTAFWFGVAGGTLPTALVAVLAFLTLAPAVTTPLQDQLLTAHVRSLMPAHLIDVESTDRHTVKPWFAGHADVSPLVADFTAQGYRLVGGRADYVDHQRAAVVVYQHGPHTVNVFSWADSHPQPANHTTRGGYRMAFFQVGDLAYCAVSDTGWDELRRLVRLIIESNGAENASPGTGKE